MSTGSTTRRRSRSSPGRPAPFSARAWKRPAEEADGIQTGYRGVAPNIHVRVGKKGVVGVEEALKSLGAIVGVEVLDRGGDRLRRRIERGEGLMQTLLRREIAIGGRPRSASFPRPSTRGRRR